MKRPRKKKDDVELQNQLLERAVDVLQETTRAESEGTKFGAYLGLKLDGFNPRQRAIAIKRINDIIFEIEMATSSFGVAPTANVPQSASPSPYIVNPGAPWNICILIRVNNWLLFKLN